MRKIAFILTILLCFAVEASAQTTWRVAQGRSLIGFKVKHLIFMDVEGRFKEFEGRVVTQQQESIDGAQMEVRIDARSIYTGINDRDKHLAGEDFFFTEKFPNITFKSKSVVKADKEGCYKIYGDLTMRGITRPIVLMAKCKSMKKLPNGSTRIDLTATGSINRFDYELKWNEMMETGNAIVSDTVDLKLKIALLNEPSLALR